MKYKTMLQLDKVARAAPHTRQIRLKDCVHLPQRDRPDKTMAAITDFLDIINI